MIKEKQPESGVGERGRYPKETLTAPRHEQTNQGSYEAERGPRRKRQKVQRSAHVADRSNTLQGDPNWTAREPVHDKVPEFVKHNRYNCEQNDNTQVLRQGCRFHL
jgi:hypothetical protein